ncbi:MAG: apolipoprotein N-acyltransferase [Mariprofundaceae bacterium]|nr:apolipoprotein N-acyltransferase [Mariprofundaceae bacterium]
MKIFRPRNINQNNLSRPVLMFLALLCGTAMPFAFAPYHNVWLGIFALAGLTWLIQSKHPFLTGYSFGFGWFGFGAWWLAPTVHDYGGLSWFAGGMIVVSMGLIMGLFPALWAWGSMKVARYNGKPYALLLILPSSIMIIEWLRGHLLTGLPWTSLGNLVLDSPASAWLSVFGVYGMAFLPALLAASLTLLCQKRQRKFAIMALVFCALFVLFAPKLLPPNGAEFRVALIQPNIPQDQRWDAAFLQQSMQHLIALSKEQADNVDLIIWPEAAVPFYLERNAGWSQWLIDHMQIWDTTVLFGGLKLFPDTDETQNGLYLVQSPITPSMANSPLSESPFAGKHHLVPFGEYVPSWLPWLKTAVPNIAELQPATDRGILAGTSAQFGSLICYESLFPEEARQRVLSGAGVLVVVTNDAWYGHSPAAWQHFQASQARAVEMGRYVLRAANTGISAIIAPDGSITATAPWWTSTAVTGTYRTSTRATMYQIWGNTPAFVFFVCLLLWLLLFKRRRPQ